MYIDRTRSYLGIVEDNQDPLKIGRVRIRVFNVFEEIPVEDIPWASPFKDLNGNASNVPEIGKILTVIFESGNIFKPEYIYAEHYNRNLEQKLKSLSDENYLSMRSLMFDHKTQIYSNDDEGLKIDYKFNNINITDSTIDNNLKDNFQKINLGDSSADQQAILGTNFLNWFDELVDNLMGDQGGPYFGNSGAPVTPNPALVAVLQKYQAMKDPKFLSKNVYINDNGAVNTVRQTTSENKDLRPNNQKIGDDWKSTNHISDIKNNTPVIDYAPKYGNGDETPDSQGSLSTDDGLGTSGATVSPPSGKASEDVLKIIKVMKSKKYKVEENGYINIVGVRYQYEGQVYSNKFKDVMWAIWKNESGDWESQKWAISTMPGTRMHGQTMKEWCATHRTQGLGIMVPAQYQNIYQFREAEEPQNLVKMKARPFFASVGNQQAYRDKHFDDDIIHFDNKNKIDVKNHGMFIHRGFPGGSSVNNWSEGCIVFSRENDFKALCEMARKHIKKIGKNSFHFTLLLSNEIE